MFSSGIPTRATLECRGYKIPTNRIAVRVDNLGNVLLEAQATTARIDERP
jgi:hypothetical protein